MIQYSEVVWVGVVSVVADLFVPDGSGTLSVQQYPRLMANKLLLIQF